MKLVLDNNILFSLMKPDSTASYLFAALGLEFFAPAFAKSEFLEHREECLSKSGLSEQEFGLRQRELWPRISFVEFTEYEGFLKQVEGALSDPDDLPYLALAVFLGAELWSDDPHLSRQPLAPAHTTKELAMRFLSGEL